MKHERKYHKFYNFGRSSSCRVLSVYKREQVSLGRAAKIANLSPPALHGDHLSPFTNHPFDALNACSGQAFHLPLITYCTPSIAKLSLEYPGLLKRGRVIGGRTRIGAELPRTDADGLTAGDRHLIVERLFV